MIERPRKEFPSLASLASRLIRLTKKGRKMRGDGREKNGRLGGKRDGGLVGIQLNPRL